MYLLILLNWRFKSFPLQLVLKLPAITPSGFNIGTIQKTNIVLKVLDASVSLRSQRIKPYIMWEELDSPGCIRAAISIAFFFVDGCSCSTGELSELFSVQSMLVSGFVIVSKGIYIPPRDQQSRLLDTKLGFVYFIYFMKLSNSEKVYGME